VLRGLAVAGPPPHCRRPSEAMDGSDACHRACQLVTRPPRPGAPHTLLTPAQAQTQHMRHTPYVRHAHHLRATATPSLPSLWSTSMPCTPILPPQSPRLTLPCHPAWRWSTPSASVQVPYKLMDKACFPMGDSVLGLWVLGAAAAARRSVTLVNTPIGLQHHPWVTYTRGAFGNSSIVLHPLKNANHSAWGFAARRSAGRFVPVRRRCGPCREMRWSSYAGSPVNDWRCCGMVASPRKRP
jgi:hypothetical protein